MESRIALLLEFNDMASGMGGEYLEKAKNAENEIDANKFTFTAYSLLSIPMSIDLITSGTSGKNNLLLFTGLRMLEENHANVNYIFRDENKTDNYIEKILLRGSEYQQAYTELRNNPGLGIKHLSAIRRWSRSTISSRVQLMGEGPEFRYEMACRYLHADIWTLLNNQAIRDIDGIMFGLLSWALEDISGVIYILHSRNLLGEDYTKKYDELNERLEEEYKRKPAQTYHY